MEPIGKRHGSKYQSLHQAVSLIWHEEGLAAFWKGHTPAQLLSVTYGIVQFGMFEVLTRNVWLRLPPQFTTDWRPATHFVCGALGGCSATLVAQPFDVIRTRLVAQGEPKVLYSDNLCYLLLIQMFLIFLVKYYLLHSTDVR